MPKAKSAGFFVLLKHVVVETRILGLLTYSKFCDREVAAIKSLILQVGVCSVLQVYSERVLYS